MAARTPPLTLPSGVTHPTTVVPPSSKLRDSLPRPLQLALAPSGPLSAWLERLVAVRAIDRGVVLGAQAFGALIPLVIVYSAVVPGVEAHSFSSRIIERLKLSGASAQTVREAIAPTTTVAHSTTVVGFVLVVVSSLSLARALQRLYELSYRLPNVGIRATHWHLLWIALIPAYLTLRPVVAALSGGWWKPFGSLLLGVVAWSATPYILLGRRLDWRTLLPGALLTAIAMTVLSAASLVYLPHSVTTSAQQFGALGVAFALLSWLVLAGFVLVGSAAGGAVATEWLHSRR